MKPNQKNRYNGRYNNRNNNRSVITRNTSLESSGPCGKLHGTALQLFEKYQAAAKDALIQNDLIQAEICQQHADHYMRLQNIAIANEQANRPQPQPQPQRQAEEVADELPTITVDAAPEQPMEAPVVETPADLSVPVAEMQEKRPALRGRRPVHARRPKTEQSPQSTETVASESPAV